MGLPGPQDGRSQARTASHFGFLKSSSKSGCWESVSLPGSFGLGEKDTRLLKHVLQNYKTVINPAVGFLSKGVPQLQPGAILKQSCNKSHAICGKLKFLPVGQRPGNPLHACLSLPCGMAHAAAANALVVGFLAVVRRWRLNASCVRVIFSPVFSHKH